MATADETSTRSVQDMMQVASAIQRCTARSLVLLDEMGKGTAPSDGAALFAATIRHFLRMGSRCPRVFATTHFHGESVL